MIPVHQPQIGDKERDYVMQALLEGEISGSGGRFLAEFEERFAKYIGVKHAIATSSGSTALHLACAALGIRSQDDVLVSAATNIASANAVLMQGATVVPVDVEPDSWCLDVSELEKAVTARTRAIMPVHLYGHACDMEMIRHFADERGLWVIEDCAEALGATFKGKKVGSTSEFGCFSFYANKVITTGEGGMLTTNDDELADRARSLKNLAFGVPRFVHYEVGFNYRMTNIQAALGLAQLERIDGILARKRLIAAAYYDRLRNVEGLRLPVEQAYVRNVFWMFALVVEPEFGRTRDHLMEDLSWEGIESRTMFCPMNMQPIVGIAFRPCPVAEDLWQNGLYLPSGCDLTEDDIDRVCKAIMMGKTTVMS